MASRDGVPTNMGDARELHASVRRGGQQDAFHRVALVLFSSQLLVVAHDLVKMAGMTRIPSCSRRRSNTSPS